MRLSRCLTQYPGRRLDLDVEFERGHRVVGFRVVVLIPAAMALAGALVAWLLIDGKKP